MEIDAPAPAQPEPRSASIGAVPVVAGAEAAIKQSQSVTTNSTRSTADENADYGFVTFDKGRKHLARVVALDGNKVAARRFSRKTGEWQTKTESREREACIPLTAAEAEESFPGCLAAWETAKLLDTLGTGTTTIEEGDPSAVALVEASKESDRDTEAWSEETQPNSAGYGVTTSSTPEGASAGCALLAELESYIRSYVTLADASYALVIALWVVATFIWTAFDAFGYLVVTSATKRSGKTRLLELIYFVAANSRLVANISPAALFRTIDAEKPTLLVDEAEMFSSAKSEYRALLNTGYRRGQTVKRRDGDYETYCPKAFALIGDVHDTLRDRSIVIEMRRGEVARRFVYATAKEEGAALRERLDAALSSSAEEITRALRSFEGLPFLTDRDEEIWTPLFVLCQLTCPDRIGELTRAAADLSAAKTAKARRYSELRDDEDRAQEEEYAVRLLRDMLRVIGDQKQITTQEAIARLREIPTSPWRRFRGDGLKDGIEGAMVVAGLLSRFGVKPSTIRIAPKDAGTGSTAKGYKLDALMNALAEIDGAESVTVRASLDMPERRRAATAQPMVEEPKEEEQREQPIVIKFTEAQAREVRAAGVHSLVPGWEERDRTLTFDAKLYEMDAKRSVVALKQRSAQYRAEYGNADKGQKARLRNWIKVCEDAIFEIAFGDPDSDDSETHRNLRQWKEQHDNEEFEREWKEFETGETK